MKKLFILPLFAGLLLLFTGCPYGHKFDTGKFPNEPINFITANSEYDDYNSTSPVIEGQRFLYFSSNRNSQGGEFDIVGSHFHFTWDKDDGSLTVDDAPYSWRDLRYVDTLFNRMNTTGNEFGPYSLWWNGYTGSEEFYMDMVAYATDISGNLDLKLVFFEGTNATPGPSEGTYTGPEPIHILNSAFDDAYISFYGPNFMQSDWGVTQENITEVLFCSNRDGDFDIYSVQVPFGTDISDFLMFEGTVDITSADILNSPSQDKCPYADGDLLVFASDRSGGYGGFDLYYSERSGNSWTEPRNFGDKINTAYNEYRPIVMNNYEFSNDLMIFSSDRPGGLGGYDLYYVGIPKMIETVYEE